jgi:hypothetical protein
VYYLAAKLGALAFEDKQLPTSRYKRTFAPAKDPRAIDALAAVVELACEGLARFRVAGAPRGLLAPIYATRRDGRPCRAVHLLNASGRALKAGDPIVNPKKTPLPMPPLPEFTLHLPGRVAAAVLATPERPGHIDLAVALKGAASAVRIPAGTFKTYALVYAYE